MRDTVEAYGIQIARKHRVVMKVTMTKRAKTGGPLRETSKRVTNKKTTLTQSKEVKCAL